MPNDSRGFDSFGRLIPMRGGPFNSLSKENKMDVDTHVTNPFEPKDLHKVSHKDAPLPTEEQSAMEAFYTNRLGLRGENVGWGRDKCGNYLAEYARDAWAAWQMAQHRQMLREMPRLTGATP